MVSFAFFLIWIIPCAVAKNIETMLVSRFIDGIAGSAFLSVAGEWWSLVKAKGPDRTNTLLKVAQLET